MLTVPRPPFSPGRAGDEVVEAVAVEVADGQCGGEEIVPFGVAAQSVVALAPALVAVVDESAVRAEDDGDHGRRCCFSP